jgi:hypothetical protein
MAAVSDQQMNVRQRNLDLLPKYRFKEAIIIASLL